jgi:hypothetical protein
LHCCLKTESDCAEIGEVGEISLGDADSIVPYKEIVGDIDGVAHCDKYITCHVIQKQSPWICLLNAKNVEC